MQTQLISLWEIHQTSVAATSVATPTPECSNTSSC